MEARDFAVAMTGDKPSFKYGWNTGSGGETGL